MNTKILEHNPEKIAHEQAQKFQTIQALRFVATFLVAWTHLRFSLKSYEQEKYSWLVNSALGAIGVDVFFVISGFVVAMSASRAFSKRSNIGVIKQFLLNRITRIAPFYWLMTIPILIYMKDIPSLRSLWNAIFFIPLFDRSSGLTSPPISFGWSLCFEVYFCVAITLLMLVKLTKFDVFNVIRLILLFYVFFSIGATFLYNEDWYLPKFIFNPLCYEFLLGAIIFYFYKKINKIISYISFILSIAWLVVISARLDYLAYYDVVLNSYNLSWLRLIMWGLPAALLVFGCVGMENNIRFKLPKWLVICGDASYSMYLIQVYTNLFVNKISIYLELNDALSIALHFSCIFGGGLLLWKLIEKPITNLAKSVVVIK